jgi:cob(I)alamin adenosyltransferase
VFSALFLFSVRMGLWRRLALGGSRFVFTRDRRGPICHFLTGTGIGDAAVQFGKSVGKATTVKSIVTKTGDEGQTGLMYNRRVSKSHPRVEACGTVDELNAALGLARATAPEDRIRNHLLAIQKELVLLMGELATAPQDLSRYLGEGHSPVTEAWTARLEDLAKASEQRESATRGWATPGGNLHSAALDTARTICRRAERRVCVLREAGQLENGHVIVYLNRLSDLLWLWAREADER